MMHPAVALGGVLGLAYVADACNYVKFTTGDGTTIAGRDMQFSQPEDRFQTETRTHPKGEKFRPPALDVKPYDQPGGLAKWTVKYGYIAFDMYDWVAAADGMNTEGLQCSMLYLPGYAQFGNAPPGSQTIPQYSLCDWALGLHSSVKEVNETIKNLNVAGIEVPGFGVLPVHWSITDKTGAGIVVEYTNNGTRAVYDNTVGVMTNSPPYDWQLINLEGYAPTMSNVNPGSVSYGNLELKPTGTWGSMVGLPGNVQGQSRFVKLAVYLHFAQQPQYIPTAAKGINLAGHLINIAELVNGTTEVPKTSANQIQYEGDTSLWSVIYNLNDATMYFRSYNNFVWQFVDLNKIDFSEGATPVYLNVYEDTPAPDVTGNFKKSKKLSEELKR